MIKANVLAIPLILVVTSAFYFPTIFTFFPIANTKMLVAACGLLTLSIKTSSQHSGVLNKDLLNLTLCAAAVSFASYLTMVVNNTPDSSYFTYVISMWVWLAAAYFVVFLIRHFHGHISVELLCFYLIGVGVTQCILAELMNNIQPLGNMIDSVLADDGFMGRGRGRIHGIGCALDVAGGRFAVLLIMIAYLLPRQIGRSNERMRIVSLIISFGIIIFVGNAIGRTTTTGMMISLAYLIYILTYGKVIKGSDKKRLSAWLLDLVCLMVVVAVLLYYSSPAWHKQIRFAFEGFFSLAEKGRWEVQSNEMLKHAFIYPDNLRCWLIGDGYMANTGMNPYYIGPAYYAFYRNTDAGYSRFLFYFGLTGLIAFSASILKAGEICIRHFARYRLMFFGILILHFIIWVKVTTDIFLAFAPFIALAMSGENDDEEPSKENPA